MPRFTFQFEALLRLRRHKRDLCRQILAHVVATDQQLAMQRADVERARAVLLGELRDLGRPGELVDIDRAAARRLHAGQLLAEVRLLDRDRELVAQQIALCRQGLVQADRDVKVLEKLEEKRRAEHQYEQERRIAHELQDAWLGARAVEHVKGSGGLL